MHILLLIILSLLFNDSGLETETPEEDDTSRIVLNTYLPEQAEALPGAVRSILENKLNQLTTRNGVGGSSINPRFIITAKIDVLSKEITPTAPPQHAYTLAVNFYIGDGIDGNLYAAYSKQTKGVGRSETKAYISALRNIRVDDRSISRFIEQGKQKIVDYYTSRCESILQQAGHRADQKRYDKALLDLMAIPQAISGCYERAMVEATNIYKSKLENECQLNISNARAAMINENWNGAARQLRGYTAGMQCYTEALAVLREIRDAKCTSLLAKANAVWSTRDAEKAASYLLQIPANAACREEAQKLAEDIGSALDEKERRAWEQEYEESRKNEDEESTDRQDQVPDEPGKVNPNYHIAAAKDVAFAYSKSLHEKTMYEVKNWN